MAPGKRDGSGKSILAMIITSFLLLGLPLMTITFVIIVLYTAYNWLLLLGSPSLGGAITTLILSISSFVAFYLLRSLYRWLRK